jgi:hypothetical protein
MKVERESDRGGRTVPKSFLTFRTHPPPYHHHPKAGQGNPPLHPPLPPPVPGRAGVDGQGNEPGRPDGEVRPAHHKLRPGVKSR